ncbi:hypothetical protein [Halomonas denitrificans]|nr:hypothetical protein [Halomonas denitrificans]
MLRSTKLRTTLIAAAAASTLAAAPLTADEFTETLDAALEAYEAEDINAAAEELAYASSLLQTMKGEAFAELLPDPLDGWSREIDMDANAAAGMFGGGVSATGTYTGGSGEVRIQMMADNPSVMTMAGMYANPQMLANMGEVVRVNRQSFVNQNGELTGVVGGRVLITVAGNASLDDKKAYLEAMDFRAIAGR